ncbi:MAG: sugar-transfer associated ATP-grasp domain-containing protein [Patescibacteria group bacterium]
MNARNLSYIRPYNKKSAIQLANNKILSKQALLAKNLPTASLFGVIKNRRDLLTFDWQALPNSFVLKPNHGLGGDGIMVIYGKKKNGPWIGTNRQEINTPELISHVSNILDGNFSLSNIPDRAFFEERLTLHPDFKTIAWQGIPDIRILIFNNVPIMAMLRLPTRESHGKANLHQGGIGVGIDLATGKTTFSIKNDNFITQHPDTHNTLSNFIIPDWDNILKIAIQAQMAIGLGYSGVDIVIDKQKGPVILEINGHPGLSIQNANLSSLKDRLERVAGLKIDSPLKGIKVAKNLFGHSNENIHPNSVPLEVEEERKIVGFVETINVISDNQVSTSIRAKIDTGIASTTINRHLATKLGWGEIIKNFDELVDHKEKFPAAYIKNIEEQINSKNDPLTSKILSIVGVKNGDYYILRPKISLTFQLQKQLITTAVAIGRNEELSYPMVIGRRDLKNFLIDPSKSLIS